MYSVFLENVSEKFVLNGLIRRHLGMNRNTLLTWQFDTWHLDKDKITILNKNCTVCVMSWGRGIVNTVFPLMLYLNSTLDILIHQPIFAEKMKSLLLLTNCLTYWPNFEINYFNFVSASTMNGNAQTNKTVLDKFLKLEQKGR